jgi:carbamoylphosphate synthase large subunit
MKAEKFVLILGAGYEQLPIYNLCKKKSLKIIAIDKNVNAPGLKLADFKISTSLRNDKDIVKKIKNSKKNIVAVLTMANDIPLVQYKISKALNLKGISACSAKLCSDKALFYKKFVKEKFKIPNYIEISKKKKFFNNLKFPLIYKPRDGRGSRGVFYLKDKKDVKNYLDRSFKTTEKKTLILQEYILGTQLSTESLIYKKKIYTAVSLRNYKDTKYLHPNVIENGGSHPAQISQHMESKINKILLKVARVLKIKEGPLKCDLVVNKGEIFILEAAPRFGGGYVASHITKILYNCNFLENYLDILLNNKIKKIIFFKKNLFVYVRFIFSKKKGKIKKIINLNKKDINKNVIHSTFFKKKGSILDKLQSHADRIGYVSTFHQNQITALKIANKFVSQIKIITS